MFSKTGDKKIDKGFEFVDRVMNNKQEKVKYLMGFRHTDMMLEYQMILKFLQM